METCPFCRVIIDKQAAATAAELQERANQSCSDASYVRIAAIAMFVFLGLSFIRLPFIDVTSWGFAATFVIVIVLIIRWQVRFGRLKTKDPDYLTARRQKNLALVLWLIAIPVGFLIQPLITTIGYDFLLQ
ncbi:MAG: hypothetical protein ACR2LM_20340 [Pyrinomonadaceae bacterium]